MKAVVGVDPYGKYAPALDLFLRLGFPSPEVLLFSAVEPVLPDASFPELGASHPMAELLRQMQAAAQAEVDKEQARLAGMGVAASGKVGFGPAASGMLAVAEQHGTELAVAGSERKGAFGSLFFGSVTRALAIQCKTSLLVGKEAVGGDLVAVVAVDGSDYAEKCAAKFGAWQPSGLKRVHVVAADNVTAGTLAAASLSHPEVAGELGMKVKETLAASRGLSSLGAEVTSEVIEGDPKDVVRDCMKASGAAVLVIGAQGHGFLDRLMLGSFALHQVVNEPTNVLVVRA
jgi:nucleotide-binding universal stress UspA family protein